jgi:hypothetical protein
MTQGPRQLSSVRVLLSALSFARQASRQEAANDMGDMQNKNVTTVPTFSVGFSLMVISNQQLEVGIEIWC